MTDLDRPLAAPLRTRKLTTLKKIAIGIGVLGLLVLVASRIDLSRDMHRLDAGMLSGAKEGGYFAIASELGAGAAKAKGSLRAMESAGSGENVTRLKSGCSAAFALVQDGSDFSGGGLELIGRLPKSESVFFLGKEADKRTTFASLAGARIGVGPEGSGSARLAKQIFALEDLGGLGVTFDNRPIADALQVAERGELDLVLVVMDEDAPLLVSTLRRGNLQIAGLANVDVVSRRLPRFRTGRIGAGQYDVVKVVPGEDKRVLRVDTLVVGNHCAGRSATIDLLRLLSDRFPDFVRHNKETPNATGLDLSPTSKAFFEHDGPELADELVPWLVDVMPPANWAYVVMAVSILFNAMGAGHRFRLWRIDDARVKLEVELSRVFGSRSTLGDIRRTEPSGSLAAAETRTHLDDLIRRFEDLGERSRKQSLSMLVPMGQEMAYRYQEGVIYETVAELRAFRRRAEAATT